MLVFCGLPSCSCTSLCIDLNWWSATKPSLDRMKQEPQSIRSRKFRTGQALDVRFSEGMLKGYASSKLNIPTLHKPDTFRNTKSICKSYCIHNWRAHESSTFLRLLVPILSAPGPPIRPIRPLPPTSRHRRHHRSPTSGDRTPTPGAPQSCAHPEGRRRRPKRGARSDASGPWCLVGASNGHEMD